MSGFSSTDGIIKVFGDSSHRALAALLDRIVVDVFLGVLVFVLPHQPKDIVPLGLFAVFVAMVLLTIADIIHFLKKYGSVALEKKEKVPVRDRLEIARKRAMGERIDSAY